MIATVEEQRSALSQTLFDIVGHFLAVALINQRAHHRCRIERIAWCKGCCMAAQRL
ncbi:hypothetical protein D3C76_1804300 [compost metagenome]